MSLSDEHRQAFINAASALFRQIEKAKFLDGQQGGEIRFVPDGTAKKALAINRELHDIFGRIYRNHGVRAIRFRGSLFVLNVDDKKHITGMTVVEDSSIETIEG